MNQLANLTTILSLFCGFISVAFSLSGHFTFSAYSIIISVILDGLDGQIARLSKSSSEFGKELDSLVDVVSFGVAPSLLGYIFIFNSFHFLASVVLFIYLMCAVVRLAKYNITIKVNHNYYFNGLPITIGGGIISSFILVYRRKKEMLFPDFLPKFFSPQSMHLLFICLVLLLAFLMVSKVRYLNLDGIKKLFGKRLKLVILSVLLVLAGAFYWDKEGVILFIILLIYLIFSPFVVKRLNKI